MPFTRASVEAYDEMIAELDPEELPPGLVENRPSGDWQYENADAVFVRGHLGPVGGLMQEALLSAGATHFYVRYDGGFDEGFAHPDRLLLNGQWRDVASALRELATDRLVAEIRRAATRKSHWGNAAAMYANASPVEAVTYALDELATDLAVRLLGESFGTGEYELYGAFNADLAAGEIEDDPNAAKPTQVE
jgi:hypothetical protein